MKRLVCITGIILIGCAVISAVFAPTGSAESVNNTSETALEEVQVYILRIDNGCLNVYKKGEALPYINTGTLSSSLPQSDVSVLKKGVEISGEDALRKALEDYCS